MKNKYLLSSILVLISIILILPNINSAKLGNYDISIYLSSPNSAHIIENWYIESNYTDLNDLENFKQRVLSASFDAAKLIEIDPNLTPHIYISTVPATSIKFDDIKNMVTFEYTTTDLFLINYFENQDEILWQFNSNLLRHFVINDLYSIPKSSNISIQFYEPLTIDEPSPGKVDEKRIYLSGFSSNELKILALEIKPPKPSFISINNLFQDMSQKGLYNYLIIIIVLIAIVFIFRKRLKSTFRGFVIKHSVIEPKKVKKDFFEDEIIEE